MKRPKNFFDLDDFRSCRSSDYMSSTVLILLNKKEKFCLSLHYNGSNSYLFVSGVKTYLFKATNSELFAYALC